MSNPTVAISASDHERIAQVRRFAQVVPARVSAVLEMLTEPNWAVRREVVHALAAMGSVAVEPLCTLLRTRRDNEARIAAAVDALVESASDVLAEVTKLAEGPDPAVVADAAQVLGRRRSVGAVAVLAGLVGHADDNVAVAAIEALGRIGGPQAIEALIAAAQSGNFFRVFPAVDVLGRSGDPRAVPVLASLLSSSMYAFETARALGRTGESLAVPPLAALLTHPSEAMIRVAAVALSDLYARHRTRYGNEDAPSAALRRAGLDDSAVRRLLRALVDASQDERAAIAFILGEVGGEVAATGLRSLLDIPGPSNEVAARSLRRLGTEADGHVREGLRAEGSDRRRALLPIVARASLAPEVVLCLDDSDATVRALACDALGRVGATSAVAKIFPLLSDPDQRVIHAAIGAIQSLGSEETKALALKAAQSEEPELRAGALRILSYFGFPEALPAFIAAIEGKDARSRDIALVGLAFLEAPEALVVILSSTLSLSDRTRGTAMRALGQSAQGDPRIDPHLIAGLSDPNAWVRYYACQALGRRGSEAATPELTTLLKDNAGQVRVAAVEALAHFRTDRALTSLRNVAEGSDPDMQRAALLGLGATGLPFATEIVLRAVDAKDPSTRLVAISALVSGQTADVLPILASATRDVDENVRSAAVGFLAASASTEATVLLIELLRSPGEHERVIPILSTPNRGRIPVLLDALATADDDLAGFLTSALARMRTPESQDALLRALRIPSVPARKAAAASLSSLRTPQGLVALRNAADHDADPEVRRICAVLSSE